MASFRKKPVVIEAVTWYGKYSGPGEWPHWFSDAISSGEVAPQEDGTIQIKTLEGVMTGNSGDTIIKGVKNELYPCKSEIFAVTYEPC